MSGGPVTEVAASSGKGFDDAVRMAIERAQQLLEHVNGARVLEQRVVMSRGRDLRFHVILGVTVDAMVSVDERQRIVEFDHSAEAIFGYSRDEVMGEPIGILIPERFRGGHEHHVEGFAASRVGERMMGERSKVVGLRKDGTEFPAQASIAKATVQGERRLSVLVRDLSVG